MRPKCVQNQLKPEAQVRFSLILLGVAGFMGNTSRVRVPSRALEKQREGHPKGCPFSLFPSPARGSKIRGLHCRSGRRRANVHRTFCDVSCSLKPWVEGADIFLDYQLLYEILILNFFKAVAFLLPAKWIENPSASDVSLKLRWLI